MFVNAQPLRITMRSNSAPGCIVRHHYTSAKSAVNFAWLRGSYFWRRFARRSRANLRQRKGFGEASPSQARVRILIGVQRPLGGLAPREALRLLQPALAQLGAQLGVVEQA